MLYLRITLPGLLNTREELRVRNAPIYALSMLQETKDGLLTYAIVEAAGADVPILIEPFAIRGDEFIAKKQPAVSEEERLLCARVVETIRSALKEQIVVACDINLAS